MKLSFFTLTLILVLGCQAPSSFSKQELIGDWSCYKLVKNSEIEFPKGGDIFFSFRKEVQDENDILTYRYKGFSYKEKGKWDIEGPLLVTQGDGLLEKEVEIRRLENDTLILDMMDRGVAMQMSFVRKK